jgi:hypothetical protein
MGLKAGLRRIHRGDLQTWCAHSLSVGVLVLLVAGFSPQANTYSNTVATPGPAPSATSSSGLQNEKLQQQIRQLQLSNEYESSPWRYLIALAPTLAGLAAILTFGLGWATQRSESSRQKDRERTQRETESIREFDARFASIVSNLGSSSISRQVTAASSLPIFLAPRYTDFRSHIIRVAGANLRLGHDKIVLDLLVDALGAAVRAHYATADQKTPDESIDLADSYLRGLNISGAQLRGKLEAERADLSQARLDQSDLWKAELRDVTLVKASLRHANLGQAHLDGANVSHAVFHAAQATSAWLPRVDGRHAMFQGAHLQSAHFEDADLRGARFDGADLADCYFLRAQFDEGALESILRTNRWRSAHFDPDIRDWILANVPKYRG